MDPLFDQFIDLFSIHLKIDEATRKEICQHLSVLKLNKKHILIKENYHHDFAYFVISGAVRSYYLKDGVEVNTWFAMENEMVGSLFTYKGKPSRETIELLENSSLIAINLKNIKPLVFTNIQIANFINAIIEDYALFLEEKLFYSQMSNSTDRFRMLLEKEPKLFQRVPLTYIASYLGISRETLSRLRAK
jgi:CRP-like cAMP-binding protein